MDEYLGEYIDVFTVRSLKAGLGATTSYIAYALDYGEIDGAIMVKADENWRARTIIIRDSRELLSAVGTKWVVTPVVDAIVEALKIERLEKIAIIGTPCQCQAIRDMMEYPMHAEDFFERIKLIVGLFCFGSFTRDGFKTMLERKFGIALPDIVRAEISRDTFVVTLRSGEIKRIKLDELKENVQFACLSCGDFTAEFSDISFGAAGSEGEWRTAIVRSETALEILKKAADAGYLEVRKMDPGMVDIVREHSREKKHRAKKLFQSRKG